jgi:C4-dicarboxylate-specific signal transduction histidine kinase
VTNPEPASQRPRLRSSAQLSATLSAFVVGLLGALSALMVTLVSGIFSDMAIAVERDLRWKAQRGARELATSAELGILLRDSELIRQSLGNFTDQDDVQAIVVVDTANRPLFVHGRAPAQIEQLFRGQPGVVAQEPERLHAWAGAEVEGTTVGRVAVLISKQRLLEGMRLRRRMFTLILAGMAGAVLLSLFFVTFYVRPLIRITELTLRDLAELNKTLEQKVTERTEELSVANGRLQDSLRELQSTQKQLMEASRKAGMADVASHILHNVGNVLNSAAAATSLLDRILARDTGQGLSKAIKLLTEHEGDLVGFFTRHPKGPHMLLYLRKLEEALRTERGELVDEVKVLQKNLAHIESIVAGQERHRRSGTGVLEQVPLRELVDDALQLSFSPADRRDLDITCQLDAVPSLQVDRHKVLQILVNLLNNARHAVRDRKDDGPRRITVRAELQGSDRLALSVEDNGCGIPADLLERIFAQGFTTKARGSGLGLHSSANMATEMGGRLSVHSGGPGHGARFTLELPAAPTRATAGPAQTPHPEVRA